MDALYKANLTAGSLLVPESRKVADLMIRRVTSEEWKREIEQKNILQKLNVASSKRIAAYIRARLEMVSPDIWQMIRDGDSVLSTQANFAATIKYSRILGDYLDLVVRDQFRKLENGLTFAIWDEFIRSCKQRDVYMGDFPSTTALKMRSAVHKILVEVGYLKGSHNWHLQRVDFEPELIECLNRNKEAYILKCIQVGK